MKKRTVEVIEELTTQLEHLSQPIHLLAVCGGGKRIAEMSEEFLKKKGIEAKHFEVWVDSVKGEASIAKTNFTKEDYIGTAVIVDDVIWSGHLLPPIKQMLTEMEPTKKFYLASLLDCNEKADFSVFK